MFHTRRRYFYENFYYNKLRREKRRHLRRRNDILNATGEDIGEFEPPKRFRHVERISYTDWLITRKWRECNRQCNESFNEGQHSDSESDIYGLNKIMRYDYSEYVVNGTRFAYEYISDNFSVYVGHMLIYKASFTDCDPQDDWLKDRYEIVNNGTFTQLFDENF